MVEYTGDQIDTLGTSLLSMLLCSIDLPVHDPLSVTYVDGGIDCETVSQPNFTSLAALLLLCLISSASRELYL
jgi:hypothetical protein